MTLPCLEVTAAILRSMPLNTLMLASSLAGSVLAQYWPTDRDRSLRSFPSHASSGFVYGQIDIPLGWTFNFAHTESHVAVIVLAAAVWRLAKRLK